MLEALRAAAAATLLVFSTPPARAQDADAALPPPEARAEAVQAREIAEDLDDLQSNIASLAAEIRALQDAEPGEGAAKDLATAADVQARVDELREELASLRGSFEDLATDGVDQSLFEDVADEPFDWRAEIGEIARPLFDELKSLTAKPREIERLRREISRNAARRDAAGDAARALARASALELDANTEERIEKLRAEWERREEEAAQAIQSADLRLRELSSDDRSLAEQITREAKAFLEGRGLMLAIAALAAFVAWWSMASLRSFVEKRAKKRRGERTAGTGFRLFLYAHRIITIFVVGGVVLATFYAFGDFLFVSLVIVVFVFAVLWLRNVLPQFLDEAKLLLGVGPVREGERVVWNGLPYEVIAINVYSVLRNPQLEGVVRLPLRALSSMTSRPPAEDEPWFPAAPGDYVLLEGDLFGQVARQTQDVVTIAVRGGMALTVPTADFFARGAHNMSAGESFLVSVTFGVAYDHQALDADDTAAKFRDAVGAALGRQSFAGSVVAVDADLAEAGPSSIDYLVLVKMHKDAAPYYFAVRRTIQKACIGLCNAEGWSIPFPQLQVHVDRDAA